MKIEKVIAIARKHLGKGEMESSARLCFERAISLYEEKWFFYAHILAVKSIAYSVGKLHPDYKKANA